MLTLDFFVFRNRCIDSLIPIRQFYKQQYQKGNIKQWKKISLINIRKQV
jgi:hypothetical protein